MTNIHRLKNLSECITSALACDDLGFTDTERIYWNEQLYRIKITLDRLVHGKPITREYLNLKYRLLSVFPL